MFDLVELRSFIFSIPCFSRKKKKLEKNQDMEIANTWRKYFIILKDNDTLLERKSVGSEIVLVHVFQPWTSFGAFWRKS